MIKAMKIIKKFSFALIISLITFLLWGHLSEVSADSTIVTSPELTIDGVQVRVSGKHGIRIHANVNNYDTSNVEKFGLLIAFGKHEASDDFVYGGTVNGSKVLNGQKTELASGTTYNVTVYNFPEDLILTTLTARAYLKLKDGTYVYGESVAYRSFGEVVLKSINDGQEREDVFGNQNLIGKVESIITSNEAGVGYMKYGMDSFNNFTISNLFEQDPTRLRDIFFNDFNNFLISIDSSDSIAADSEWYDFYSATAPHQILEDGTVAGNTENTDISTSNLFKFFKEEKMNTKWGWILDWFSDIAPSFHISRQVAAIRSEDGTYVDNINHSNYISDDCTYNLLHLVSSLYSFLYNVQKDQNGSGSIIFGTIESYGLIDEYNDSIYADLSKYEVVKIGETITLPDQTVGGEVNTGYTSGSDSFNVSQEIVVGSTSVSYTPTFTTGYTITYVDNNNNVIAELAGVYDGTKEIVLPKYQPEGYIFEGWYETSDFTGDVVTKISTGELGDKTYYAKLTEGISIVVDATWTDKASGDVVSVDGINYTFGTTAFNSVIDAITYANTLTDSNNTCISVNPGDYTYADNENTVTLSVSNIKIVGPNANVSGNAERNEEAVIDNLFLIISPNLQNIEINGLKFINNSKIYCRDTTYGTSINGFKFNNNYVITTNAVAAVWSEKSSGFIEFDAASTYYSYNIEITNNYFAYDLTNNTTAKYEVELIALDNVCDVNISNNTFKNIKDNAIHIYDTNKGLSGETNKFNNNTFDTVYGDAIKLNWISPSVQKGTNNTIEIDNNTFKDVTGTCINIGYDGGAGNSADLYKEISLSENTFDSASENFIYINKCFDNWTIVLDYNIYNYIPSGYYIYAYTTSTTNILYPKNNQYLDGGSELGLSSIDSTKFTENVVYAEKYSITYYYNSNEITELGDMYAKDIVNDYQLPTYTVENGIFEGWYDNPSFTGSAITCIPAGSTGDKVFYAKITITYNITYIYNGEEVTGLTPTTYAAGSEVALPEYQVGDASKYLFEGWYTNSNLISGYMESITSDIYGDLVLYAKVTIVKTQYAVDDDWAGTIAGTVVTLNGVSYTYGTNAFATIVDAITAVNALGTTANVNINVAAGTYTGSFDIKTSGVKFSGPNEGIDGNATRNTEAIISDTYIRFGAQVGDIEINGFKLAGTSRVYKSDKSITGTSSSFTTDVNGFKFVNNYVDTANTNGFLQFIDSSYSYSKNLIFTNNYFTQSATATNYLCLNNCYNVIITNNTFKNITGTAVYIDGGTVGLIGEHSEFNNNIFDTIAADAILIKNIDPIGDAANPAIDFNDNTFRSVTGTCIKINQIKGNANFGSKSYSAISVINNIFDTSFANGIYVTTHSSKMNLAISGNVFNVIPSSYYIYLGSTTVVYALGNEYLDGGSDITSVDSSKFSSNVVYEPQPIEITSMGDGNGVVKIGDTIKYTANYAGGKWTSSNTDIATVDQNGVITGISAGSVNITVEYEGSSFTSGVTVYDDTYSALMQLILLNNTGILLNQDVTYIGYLSGYEKMVHNIYDSANNYWPGTITIDSTSYKLSSSDGNYGVAMTPKYITVHDTGSTTTNAKQTSQWCINSSNTSSSWHYSTGTDGVYQHIPDTITAGHAGDGSRAYGFTKTQVKGTPGSTVQLPVTIKSGYFYLGGQYTGVAAPTTATTKLPTIGIYHYVGSDGYYYLANTYYNTSYNTISMKGGNRHSIGIESSVKYGTDIYLTWQMTAKLVAQLCVKWDLNTAQVRQHNNFSGKDCPGTMRNAGLWEEFMEIVEVEYQVLKNYSEWKITFDSSNESYLYNNGRVQNRPEKTVPTSYTVKVTSPSGVVETATLYVIIPGHENNVLDKW